MKLTIDNVGILKHAELDLTKDLIILCGPNNTGKTYAAYVAYAVNQFALHTDNPLIHYTQQFVALDEELYLNGTISIDIWKHFVENEEYFSNQYVATVDENLYSVFDTNKDFFKTSTLKIEFDPKIIQNRLLNANTAESIKYGPYTFNYLKSEGHENLNVYLLIDSKNDSLKHQRNRTIAQFLHHFVSNFVFQNIFYKSYITPVERIAIDLFSRQLLNQRNKLVNDLMTSGSTSTNGSSPVRGSGFKNKYLANEKLYSLPIRDSLDIANQLLENQKQDTEFGYLAELFEQEILHGKVSVSEYGEMQFLPHGVAMKPIGIHLSGSIVKSLSSLVFYFRHIAQKGDFIIIDEPELNLHPDNQRKVARMLARIVNAGFKVMISTHSDYIYRELNNQIMLRQDSDMARELAERHKYDEKELLDYKNVGVYLFEQNAVEVQMLPVTETGFEIKTIDAEISSLNEASMEIYTYLY